MKKTYRVVGDSIVHETSKGCTFVADLEEHAEALLIAGGHIIVEAEKKAKAKYETAAVDLPVETADEKK